MNRIGIVIEGVDPAPQGSKTAFMVKDPADRHKPKDKQRNHPWARPTMMESSSKRLAAYRKGLVSAFKDHSPGEPLTGPVETRIAFVLPRPAAQYRSGKFAAVLRPAAPRWRWAWPSGRGDLDKLTRAVHDALKIGGWYGDDVQVVRSMQSVTWCERDEPPRTLVVVTMLEPREDVAAVQADYDKRAGRPPGNV
jgi:Holliday junction resolvase RusA-like endonuclease